MTKNKTILLIGITIVVILGIIVISLIRNREEGESVVQSLFPFGNPSRDTVSFDPQNENPDLVRDPSFENGNSVADGIVRKLSDTPVSGATVFNRGTSTLVRFLEKATGHIYEVNLTQGSRDRISNTTIPKTEEVLWGRNGESFLMRSSGDGIIRTILGQFASSSPNDQFRDVQTTELVGNALIASYSPERTNLFLGVLTYNGGIEGILGNELNPSQKTIFSYPINDFVVEWPETNTIALTTKASADIQGSLFILNPITGTLTYTLSAPGLLTKISPDGKTLLFSSTQNGYVTLSVRSLATTASQNVPLATFAEKCAWISNSSLICLVPSAALPKNTPDFWYRGENRSTDMLWKYNIITGETREILEFASETRNSVDGEILQVERGGNYALIRNKKDGILWSVDTREATSSPAFVPSSTTTPAGL